MSLLWGANVAHSTAAILKMVAYIKTPAQVSGNISHSMRCMEPSEGLVALRLGVFLVQHRFHVFTV